jgi:hypothetical protein
VRTASCEAWLRARVLTGRQRGRGRMHVCAGVVCAGAHILLSQCSRIAATLRTEVAARPWLLKGV